ncbi:Gfo/Idh/MocA family protein [Serinibacter salmoneus]|uniref:Putative dehydrogenase n=1 Tax=Serinibacter salmoneus TaxID=556530 RepID=A0A2A9CX76_9MICO|nr:Gfo/Idh/MocA family oxidoreductase [Serinibacter salmoneus]PFG18741.1 putative dehydrogenase [Serinibacter salmoneus]
MSEPIRWGILGPGRIAANVAKDFGHVSDGVIAAVGSRSAQRAAAFAAEHAPGARAHGSYRDLLADPAIDAVYVATPHSQHAAQAIAAIREHKAVLVEKAFTATLPGARRVVGEARSRDAVVMEAMWTRFQPAVVRARELIADGAIGEVRAVAADLGVSREFDPNDRLFSLELGGGTLLDLGVYVVSFAQMVLGEPVGVTAKGSLLSTGVDAEAGLLVDFGSGATATLQTSFRSPMPGNARIYGSTGWIELPPRFHHPHRVILHRAGKESIEESLPPTGAGYALEFDEVNRLLRAGRTESEVMPLRDSLAVMGVLQSAADQLGVALVEDEHAGL